MTMKDDIKEILREHGLTDEPERYAGNIHSWRCEYPERYGKCRCFEELADDLTPRGAIHYSVAIMALLAGLAIGMIFVAAMVS